MVDACRRVDILYVGTLPPHHGGTAIVGYQLLASLAQIGHHVRAVAPITSDTVAEGDRFSRSHPAIELSRYLVPFFNTASNEPLSPDYQDAETSAIVRAFEMATSQRRPDVLIIGRESFAWRLPDLARTKNIPSMLLVQGA